MFRTILYDTDTFFKKKSSCLVQYWESCSKTNQIWVKNLPVNFLDKLADDNSAKITFLDYWRCCVFVRD
jgi:hypothetical protein